MDDIEEYLKERKEFNKTLAMFCKNSNWVWKFHKANEGEEELPPEFINEGCNGQRSIGSSRCEECSRLHKETGLQYPFLSELINTKIDE